METGAPVIAVALQAASLSAAVRGCAFASLSQQSVVPAAGGTEVHVAVPTPPHEVGAMVGLAHCCVEAAPVAANPSPSQSAYQFGAVSSVLPLQLLSLPSQSSEAPAKIVGSSSLQSSPQVPSFSDACPSPSASVSG